MKKLGWTALAAVAFAAAQPALAASEWPVDPGDYVEIGMIKVDDGHALDYANYLAGQWRKSQDYAKSQGWISDYQIWTNQYPREGEPDVYLVTWFPKIPDAAESMRRNDAYLAHMKQTETQLQAASGKRAEYRHMAGSMMFQVQKWAK